MLDYFPQCRPTPTYVWKARRRKFQKRKYLVKKKFEILELASDIDTDDDCHEEQIETTLDNFHQKGHNPLTNHANKLKWLNQTLNPLRHRKCSSDESDSEEAHKNNSSAKNKNFAAICSSEEDTCDVDRESDHEYFHVWGESDSGHSDLNVAEDVDVTAGSSLLENVPLKKKAYRRRKFAREYDAPSPEPFLPDANEPSKPIQCVHKIPVSDALAMSLINLGISNPCADMPHFHCIPPFDVVEKPFDFVTKRDPPQHAETTPNETSAICKRLLPSSLDEECTPCKVMKVADNPSPPSPSNSARSFSPPNSDNEATLPGVDTAKRNLAVKFCNESSPFQTPVSDMDQSPAKTPRIASLYMYP